MKSNNRILLNILIIIFVFSNVHNLHSKTIEIYDSVFTIPIATDMSYNIEGIDVKIKYDTNNLKFIDARLEGGFLENNNYSIETGNTTTGIINIIISADFDILRGIGELVFVTFETITKDFNSSSIIIEKFECNEKKASGGFLYKNNTYQNLNINLLNSNLDKTINILKILTGILLSNDKDMPDILFGNKIGIQNAVHSLNSLFVPKFHSADYSPKDFKINLSELLRVIELYNLKCYYYNENSDDGYSAGVDNQNTRIQHKFHDSDFPHEGIKSDWKIDTYELMRIFQFYNAGYYKVDKNGEDGFNPVLKINNSPQKNFIKRNQEKIIKACYEIWLDKENNYKINTTINYSGNLMALAVKTKIAKSFKYVSVYDKNSPAIISSNIKSNYLEFIWITPPKSPFSFHYTLSNIKNELSEIQSNLIYRRMGGQKVLSIKNKNL